MGNKLYVGNLSYATTEDDLKTLFAKAGTVASVEVIKDRETGRSKGFAFVQMSTDAEAEDAIRLVNGQQLDNRDLRVSIARPREENRGGFGGPRRSDSGSGSGSGRYDARRSDRGGERGGNRSRGPRDGGSQR
ncbi:MAG: RNA recognition motif domain-containing protein [Anaerolineaceae bacterium]|jgi:RNA recognition motif-containing protein|nr:MAG: RNA-binding protein [Chloroflexi bacterium HGW-Chloroflexi-8]